MNKTKTTTPTAHAAGSAVRVGDRVSVPRVANPRRIWWVTVVEVAPCGRFAKVKGKACFGGIRWVGVSEIREGLKPRKARTQNAERSGGRQ